MNVFEIMAEIERLGQEMSQLPDDHLLKIGCSIEDGKKQFDEFATRTDRWTDPEVGLFCKIEDRMLYAFPEAIREPFWAEIFSETVTA